MGYHELTPESCTKSVPSAAAPVERSQNAMRSVGRASASSQNARHRTGGRRWASPECWVAAAVTVEVVGHWGDLRTS